MKISKSLTVLALMSMLLMMPAGCVWSAPSADGIDYDAYHHLTSLSASIGSSYYPIACKMAEMFPRYDKNLYATAQASGGGAENIKLVSAGDAEIGMANQINFALAAKGLQAFKGDPISNLRLLLVYAGPKHVSTDAVQFAVPANSDIHSIYDFKGKNVSIGPAGSSCNNYVSMLLESAGVNQSDFRTIQYLNYDEQLSAMSDGLIDVASYYSGTPTAGLEQLAATVDIRLIPVDEEVAKKATADWGFATFTITPQIYRFLKEDVLCVQVAKHSVFVNQDMDVSLAYRITKNILDSAETELWDVNSYSYGLTKDNLNYGWSSIPVHPGAIRYYEDNGIAIPDGCYPPEYPKK
jgi:TRAP transporter TAXI family solute receptor